MYSDVRALKVDLTFAIGGIKNHELYFAHLGGEGGDPDGAFRALVDRDFGSVDAWRSDLRATAIAARGWAWTAYDWDERRLFNYLGDAQNTFPVWNATPLSHSTCTSTPTSSTTRPTVRPTSTPSSRTSTGAS